MTTWPNAQPRPFPPERPGTTRLGLTRDLGTLGSWGPPGHPFSQFPAEAQPEVTTRPKSEDGSRAGGGGRGAGAPRSVPAAQVQAARRLRRSQRDTRRDAAAGGHVRTASRFPKSGFSSISSGGPALFARGGEQASLRQDGRHLPAAAAARGSPGGHALGPGSQTRGPEKLQAQ